MFARNGLWVAIASLLGTAAWAQVPEAPVSIVGTVISANVATVILNADGAQKAIAMTPGWEVVAPHNVAATAIKPGDFIASANVNIDETTGRATELRIMEPGYRPENGTHPIGRPNMSMTHGTVASVQMGDLGERLQISFPAGSRILVVPTDVKVTGYEVLSMGAASMGAKVEAITRKGSDGVARASRLLLLQP